MQDFSNRGRELPESTKAILRPVILPPDLIGKRAPCDLFNAYGVLLVSADSVIAFSPRHPFRPTRVFCPADQAERISDIDPIVQLAKIGQNLAQIGARLVESKPVSPDELIGLARMVHEAWILDADACLGYARLCKFGRPSVCHVIHAALFVAELAAAQRMDAEQALSVIGGALTMNIAKLKLHDEMYACSTRPSPEQMAEIRSHPAAGANLLRDLGEIDKSWLEAIEGHHENIDGSGYPHARKGTQNALSARMIRVADIFAARLTGRMTRPPLHWNIQRTRSARNIVQHVFGRDQRHLDPSLMNQLIRVLGRFPPGTMVRLNNRELAVVARRIPGELENPREVLVIKDALGHALKTPRLRCIGSGEYEIRNYANDELQRMSSYHWQKIWGYGA